jgi:ZIP family zinc transporter
MGFAGGAMIGVALFETMPEAFELAPGGAAWVAVVVALGVIAFAALERKVFHHVHVEDGICNPRAAEIGAGGITTHAFLDGLAIGSAFQISPELGLLVSSAVLLHAFADGLNTVTILLRHGHRHRTAIAWLVADAAAPILGASIGLLIPLPDPVFAALLAFFAGMFLYFGAGSLLPQAHRAGRNRAIVIAAAVAGIGLAFTAASLA